MVNDFNIDCRKDEVEVTFLSNDIVLTSRDNQNSCYIKLTSDQMDKIYADMKKWYGEPTPAEQEDKILSLENRNEELENLVEQYQER